MPTRPNSKATTLTSIAVIGIAVFAGMAGCQKSQSNAPETTGVSYITADELAETVSRETDLVLVEFCVPSGCFRCDEMRSQIDQIAEEERGRLAVRRINLQQERALSSQLGVAVCPTYVGFRDGKEVFRAAYPTSADLLVAKADEHLQVSPVE